MRYMKLEFSLAIIFKHEPNLALFICRFKKNFYDFSCM